MSKKIPLTDNFLFKVKELFDYGYGSRTIAKKLNVDRRVVHEAYKALRVFNIGRKKPRIAHKATEKKCKRCQQIKPVAEFRKRYNSKTDRHSFECYCLNCEELIRKEKYNQNVEFYRRRARESNRVSRDVINTRERNRIKNDPVFRLRKKVSSTIRSALLKQSSQKDDSILNHLPYSFEELKQHLEAQFEPWMSWENYGRYDHRFWNDDDPSTWKWNIDHIIPQSKLPYKYMEEENFKKCWALENLRPMSAKENLIKGNKIL